MKEKRINQAWVTVGSILVDLGKLLFGGLLLGSLLKSGFDPALFSVLGGVLSAIFIAVGVFTILKGKE